MTGEFEAFIISHGYLFIGYAVWYVVMSNWFSDIGLVGAVLSFVVANVMLIVLFMNVLDYIIFKWV